MDWEFLRKGDQNRDVQSSQAPSGALSPLCMGGSGAGGDRLLPIERQLAIEPRVENTMSESSNRIDPKEPSLMKWISSTLILGVSINESRRTLVSAKGLMDQILMHLR